MDKPSISPEKPGQKPLPPESELFRLFPPEPEQPVMPPILTGEIPDDAPLAERITSFGTSKKSEKKNTGRRRFLGIRLPSVWRNLSLTELILALLTTRRGLGLAASLILHLILFILLSILMLQWREASRSGEPLTVSFSEQDELVFSDFSDESAQDMTTLGDTLEMVPETEPIFNAESILTPKETAAVTEVPSPVSVNELSSAAEGELNTAVPVIRHGATSGRTAANRRSGLPGREGDTTEASEQAVEAGLAWLAHHQLPDGGWAFNLDAPDDNQQAGECQGQCSNSTATAGGGIHRQRLHPSRMAATGLALLPFLGAGYTHTEENPYRETIRAGLEFLRYRAQVLNEGIDFCGTGTDRAQGIYTQAIVTVTLCEAYEMTADPELRPMALGGGRYLIASQLEDGGWRYKGIGDSDFFTHVPGDTSVSGWVMQALKSGISAGFEVEQTVLYRIEQFLDQVADDRGSIYHYQAGNNESDREIRGTTAVGLLMREYLGWGPEKGGLKRGVSQLSKWFKETEDDWKAARRGETGTDYPLISGDGRFVYNLYYAYYAALTMHHLGGKPWKKAFPAVREFLIDTQSKGNPNPHEKGSWLFYDRYLNDGGRLLNTALSILILETPYRYLPMYQKEK